MSSDAVRSGSPDWEGVGVNSIRTASCTHPGRPYVHDIGRALSVAGWPDVAWRGLAWRPIPPRRRRRAPRRSSSVAPPLSICRRAAPPPTTTPPSPNPHISLGSRRAEPARRLARQKGFCKLGKEDGTKVGGNNERRGEERQSEKKTSEWSMVFECCCRERLLFSAAAAHESRNL